MGEENHWWFRELAAGRTATRNVATMEGILPDLPSLSNVIVNIFHASKAAEKQARPDTGLYFYIFLTMACMPLPESLAYRPIGHRMSLHIECLWFQAGTSKMSPISLLKQSGVHTWRCGCPWAPDPRFDKPVMKILLRLYPPWCPGISVAPQMACIILYHILSYQMLSKLQIASAYVQGLGTRTRKSQHSHSCHCLCNVVAPGSTREFGACKASTNVGQDPGLSCDVKLRQFRCTLCDMSIRKGCIRNHAGCIWLQNMDAEWAGMYCVQHTCLGLTRSAA